MDSLQQQHGHISAICNFCFSSLQPFWVTSLKAFYLKLDPLISIVARNVFITLKKYKLNQSVLTEKNLWMGSLPIKNPVLLLSTMKELRASQEQLVNAQNNPAQLKYPAGSVLNVARVLWLVFPSHMFILPFFKVTHMKCSPLMLAISPWCMDRLRVSNLSKETVHTVGSAVHSLTIFELGCGKAFSVRHQNGEKLL